MTINFNSNTNTYIGDNGETYRLFEYFDKGKIKEIKKDLDPTSKRIVAIRDFHAKFDTPEEIAYAIGQEFSQIPCEDSLCQICGKTGALSGCPKQASSVYKTLSEREDPVEGWDADPTEDLVRVKLGDIFIPTLVRGWHVRQCPLFEFRFRCQATFEYFKLIRMMMLRRNNKGEWETPDRCFLSRSKDVLEAVWNTAYEEFPMWCEEEDEEEE